MDTKQLNASEMALIVIEACQKRPEVGRTSLQKVAYFASVSMKLNLGHEAHLYGPYSRMLDHEIGALVFAGEVEETRQVRHTGSGERVQYRYELTPAGVERLKSLDEAQAGAVSQVRRVVEQVEAAAGGLSQAKLSPAAKTFFLIEREGSVADFSEVQRLATEYKWALRDDQEDEVIALLTSLGLVTTTA